MDHTQYTTNGAERKPGTHLTMEDRGAIQAMKKLGYSNRAIARYLHCAPSTISNELKRGTPPRTGSRGRAPGYSAKRGDAVYKENRKNSHKPHRIDKCTSFVQWVVTQVRTEKWSINAKHLRKLLGIHHIGHGSNGSLLIISFPASKKAATKNRDCLKCLVLSCVFVQKVAVLPGNEVLIRPSQLFNALADGAGRFETGLFSNFL